MAMADHKMTRLYSYLKHPVSPGQVRLRCKADGCHWMVWAWGNGDTKADALRNAQGHAREHRESQRLRK
jgi:hypothetical protein